MTYEEKEELVNEVMQGFNFDKVRAIESLSHNDARKVPSIDEMKHRAKRNLLLALDHQDREFWWAGGMHRGGLVACFDNKWGLSLNYIAVASRKQIFKRKEL